MLRIFSVAISVSSHIGFILDLTLISMFLRYFTYELGIFHSNQTAQCLKTIAELKARVGRLQSTSSVPASNFIAGRPRALFRFGSVVVLDVL